MRACLVDRNLPLHELAHLGPEIEVPRAGKTAVPLLKTGPLELGILRLESSILALTRSRSRPKAKGVLARLVINPASLFPGNKARNGTRRIG